MTATTRDSLPAAEPLPTAGQRLDRETIGDYLIGRLWDYGIRDIFGLPGDYVLRFYHKLEHSPLRVINCTREDGAGFAADAYARINGLGAVCVTYCVGGLSLCNSIAGAYAEKSPVVVISGAPGLSERTNNPLLHHKVRDFHTQLEVFEKLCVAGNELNDPLTAAREIDRVLDAAVRYKRPVYLELPRDMVDVPLAGGSRYQRPATRFDAATLGEAVEESLQMLAAAQRPLILAGVEVHRFRLQDDVLALAEGSHIPIASTVLGKGTIRERHPLYIGVYEGAMGDEDITQYVEESDCLLLLGTFMSDVNLGIFTANLDPGRCIYATSEQLRIRYHHYPDVPLTEFLRALAARCPPTGRRPVLRRSSAGLSPPAAQADAPLTITRLIARLNEMLDDHLAVVCDVGDALFSAMDLVLPERAEFLAPAYYASMGFAVPAAVGVQAARRELRPIVLVGDGAFQMTGMEMSTLLRQRFDPVLIVLDNGGYGTERLMHPGNFNDIQPWKYHLLPQLLGGGQGCEVFTEGEFQQALRTALADKGQLHLIQAHLPPDDRSRTLDRLAQRVAQRIGRRG